MAYRWSEGQNKLLIKLVEERPCLWQKNDPEHGDKNIKEANWEQIDQLLGTNGACRRFRSIRDDYTRWTKGTRKGFCYAADMHFIQGQIGHRSTTNNNNSNKRKSNSNTRSQTNTSAATIELLDESTISDGLYEDDDDDDVEEGQLQGVAQNQQHPPQPPPHPQQQQLVDSKAFVHTIHPNHSHPFSQLGIGYLDETAENGSPGMYLEPEPETAKRPRFDTPSSAQDSTDWQAPVDNTILTQEDYQYCKTIISAMSSLPKARQRKLKSRIYNLITDDVNNYEAGFG